MFILPHLFLVGCPYTVGEMLCFGVLLNPGREFTGLPREAKSNRLSRTSVRKMSLGFCLWVCFRITNYFFCLSFIPAVAHWRAQDPPGRFLAKDPDTGGKENPFYYEVGDEAAKKRTAKSLSERIKGVYTIRSSMGASPIPPSPATVLSEELTTFLPPPTPEPQQEDDLLSYYLGKAPEKASKRTHAAPPGELERKQSKFLEGVVEESISRLGHTWKGSLQGLQTERSATEAVSDDDSLPTAADLLQGEMFP